jgi:hypothetical protein
MGGLATQATAGAGPVAIQTLEKAWDAICRDQNPSAQLQVESRGMTTFVVDVAREVASIACRYGGGTAIRLDCVLQRCLRDLQGEPAHLLVSDISYELWGQCMLGMEGVDPMS